MNVPLLDLKRQYQRIRAEIEPVLAEIYASQYFILGPRVESCEAAIAAYCDASYGIGVSSGTDALLICLMAEGIGQGDEVITTPYSFFATAGCISRVGAKPVFVDIDPLTFNIDPDQIEAKITARTRALIPVHLYGQSAWMDPIMSIAVKHDLVVIEDAAQAIGATYKHQKVGALGHYGCFSFFPTKNLGGFGDGGMVVTDDEERAHRVRTLRNHGMEPKYEHKVIGGNFRLAAMQAAVVEIKLRHLETWTNERRANADRYRAMFAATGASVELPTDPASKCSRGPCGCRHIYNQFVVRVPARNRIRTAMAEQGVGTEVYYPIPLHLQACFRDLGGAAGDHPVSERMARQSLALPIFPELTDDEAQAVVDALVAAL